MRCSACGCVASRTLCLTRARAQSPARASTARPNTRWRAKRSSRRAYSPSWCVFIPQHLTHPNTPFQPNPFAHPRLTGLLRGSSQGGGAGLDLGKERLKKWIESFGGRVTSAVSGKTGAAVTAPRGGVDLTHTTDRLPGCGQRPGGGQSVRRRRQGGAHHRREGAERSAGGWRGQEPGRGARTECVWAVARARSARVCVSVCVCVCVSFSPDAALALHSQ